MHSVPPTPLLRMQSLDAVNVWHHYQRHTHTHTHTHTHCAGVHLHGGKAAQLHAVVAGSPAVQPTVQHHDCTTVATGSIANTCDSVTLSAAVCVNAHNDPLFLPHCHFPNWGRTGGGVRASWRQARCICARPLSTPAGWSDAACRQESRMYAATCWLYQGGEPAQSRAA